MCDQVRSDRSLVAIVMAKKSFPSVLLQGRAVGLFVFVLNVSITKLCLIIVKSF